MSRIKYYDSTTSTWKYADMSTGGSGGAVTSVNGQTGAVTLDADDVGAADDTEVMHLSGNETATGIKTFAEVDSPIIQTGSTDSAYFQCRKFRGEGTEASYYHAIDYGYANHNQVDFYEYGGVWNFYKNTASTKGGTLCAAITSSGIKEGSTLLSDKYQAILSTSDKQAIADMHTDAVTSVNGSTGAVTLDIPSALSALSDDTTHRVVTDSQISAWDAKADTNDIPTALSELTDDTMHRLVSDTEKNTWNEKADTDDIPTTLAELTSDTTHRVVTDTEKTTWNSKQTQITSGSGQPTSSGSAGDVYIDINDTSDSHYITSGETISFTTYMDVVPGVLTSDSKDMYFTIHISKNLGLVTTATLTTFTGGIRHANGGYISDGSAASSSSNWMTGSAVTSRECVINYASNTVRVYIGLSSAAKIGTGSTTATNNVPIIGLISWAITFT